MGYGLLFALPLFVFIIVWGYGFGVLTKNVKAKRKQVLKPVPQKNKIITLPRRSAYNKVYGENYATPSERIEYICRNAVMTTQAADAVLL